MPKNPLKSAYREVKTRLAGRPPARPQRPQAAVPLVKPAPSALRPAATADVTRLLGLPAPTQPPVKHRLDFYGYTRPAARSKDKATRLLEAVAPDQADEARENVFGEESKRRAIPQARRDEIDAMRVTGAAVPVSLTAKDGHRLSGNFIAARGSNLKESQGQPDLGKPVVLLLTGSGGSAEDQGLDMAKFYRESGASCLSVNYRGFGGSDAQPPSEQGLVDDAQDMLEYLLKMGYTPDQIVIHGYSMGGAVAALLEKGNAEANPQMKFRGAVYDRPMTSVKESAEASLIEDDTGKLMAGAMALGAEAAVGFKSTRKAILASDPDRPRLLATDESAHVGAPGKKMRGKLEKELGQVEGQDTGAGHFDHAAMLRSNEAGLLSILHPDPIGDELTDQADAYDGVVALKAAVSSHKADVANLSLARPKWGPDYRFLKQDAEKLKALQDWLATLDAELLRTLDLADEVRSIREAVAALEGPLSEARRPIVAELRIAATEGHSGTPELIGLLEHRFGEDEGTIHRFVAEWDETRKAMKKGGDASKAVARLEQRLADFKDPDARRVLRAVVIAPLRG